MNKGIIIVFDKNDIDIKTDLPFKSFFKKIKICLVNNGNHKKMLKLLNELKDASEYDISILNLKKQKESMLAVKAGVRFLSTIEDVDLIVYARPKNLLNIMVIEKVLSISDEELLKKKDERVLLRRVYSVNEIINC